MASEETLLDKMVLAVERVRKRLLCATAALEAAGVPYAVAGSNAVAAWIARIDPAAVRNTQEVDILLRRSDFDCAGNALEAAGFVRRHVAGADIFVDGPDAKVRDSVRIIPACEMFRAEDLSASPDVDECEKFENFQVIALEPLVRMNLGAFQLNERVDIRDMLDVGLIDQSWKARLPADLGERLQQLIDTPEG